MRDQLLQDIDRTIKQAALEGTLTEDAIGYYNGLIKIAEEKKEENAALKKEIAQKDDMIRAIQRERDDARAVRDELIKRQDDLTAREENMTKLELEAEYERRRVADHVNMVTLIFRNPVTHSQMVTPGHPGTTDQYGNVQNQAWPEKHDVTTEEK